MFVIPCDFPFPQNSLGGGGWGNHPSHDFPPQNGIFNPDHQGARLGF